MRRTDMVGTTYGIESRSPPANPVGTSKYTSLEFEAFGSGHDAKHSRASAPCFFLSKTMVFAAVRTHFPKKNSRLYLDGVTFESGYHDVT